MSEGACLDGFLAGFMAVHWLKNGSCWSSMLSFQDYMSPTLGLALARDRGKSTFGNVFCWCKGEGIKNLHAGFSNHELLKAESVSKNSV